MFDFENPIEVNALKAYHRDPVTESEEDEPQQHQVCNEGGEIELGRMKKGRVGEQYEGGEGRGGRGAHRNVGCW